MVIVLSMSAKDLPARPDSILTSAISRWEPTFDD